MYFITCIKERFLFVCLFVCLHFIPNVCLLVHEPLLIVCEQLLNFFFISAMEKKIVNPEVRTPTNTWSGLGFSKSMPASAIKELVSKAESSLNRVCIAITETPDSHGEVSRSCFETQLTGFKFL